MALKLKLVRGRGYETSNSKEVEKEHKEEVKADEDETAENEAPVPLVTHVNNILYTICSNVEMYINNQQFYKFNGLYAHKNDNSNNFKGAISEYKGVLHCEVYVYEELPDEFMGAPLPELFSEGERKCLADLMASCCMLNWMLASSPLLNCYIQI